MQNLFYDCQGLDPDVTGWTIQNPTTMSSIFRHCYNFRGVGLSSWSVTCPLGIHYYLQNFAQYCRKLGDGIDIDVSGITDGAYIYLYRDDTGVIEIESIIAYDRYDNIIVASQWSSLGPDGSWGMSNAVATPETVNQGTFWSTNSQSSSGMSGGWIKYPKMPYRLAIIMRSGYTNRKPHYLKSSFLPPNGTDFTIWTTRYVFDDSSDPSNYYIALGGGWDYSCCRRARESYDQCETSGRDSIFRMENCQFVTLDGTTGTYSLYRTLAYSFGRDSLNKMEYDTNGIYFKNWNIDFSSSPYSGTENTCGSMLYSSRGLMNADVSGWTLTDVISMNSMFQYAYDFLGNGLGTWVVSNCDTTWTNFFHTTYLSVDNYSKFLIQANTWTNQPATTLYANVSYYQAADSQSTLYSAAASARASLISKGWTITDMGEGPASADLFFRAGARRTQGNLFDCVYDEHKPIVYNNIFISTDSISNRYCVWNDDPSTMGPLSDTNYTNRAQISFHNALNGTNTNWTIALVIDMMSNDTTGSSSQVLHGESGTHYNPSAALGGSDYVSKDIRVNRATRVMSVDEFPGGGNGNFATYDPDNGSRNGKMLMVIRHRADTGKLHYAERWSATGGWTGIQEVGYSNSSRYTSAHYTSLLNRFNMYNDVRRARLYAMAKWSRWLTDTETYSLREDRFRYGSYR
jgi:hypothetical protein